MKNNAYTRLAQLGCGQEILNSCSERGEIQAAVSNCNQFIRYAKKCLLNYKETQSLFWKEAAEIHLLPYYNKLLEVEPLAKKYHELWGEKFYKTKLTAEKILNK